MFKVLCLVIGYLFGCIQFAFIIGKLSDNIDIRSHGSGNAGTTNVLRVLGVKAGVITFLGDFIKAFVAITICKLIFDEVDVLVSLYTGIGVIIGHNWPFYLKFKGGKGIASTIGAMLAVDYRVGLIIAAIIVFVIIVSRYVSLGSIIMAIATPIVIYFFYRESPYITEIIIVSLLFTISALYRHRANVGRLLSGNESKIGERVKHSKG